MGIIRQLAMAATASGVLAYEPTMTPMARNAVMPRTSTGSTSGQPEASLSPNHGSSATPTNSAVWTRPMPRART